MDEPAKPTSSVPDEDGPTVQRPAGKDSPAAPELDSTLMPSELSPAAGGAPSQEHAWSLLRSDRQRYLLQGIVAEGGQGRILRAEDLQLKRMVALKELSDSEPIRSPKRALSTEE